MTTFQVKFSFNNQSIMPRKRRTKDPFAGKKKGVDPKHISGRKKQRDLDRNAPKYKRKKKPINKQKAANICHTIQNGSVLVFFICLIISLVLKIFPQDQKPGEANIFATPTEFNY